MTAPPAVTRYVDPTRVPLTHVIAAACEGLRAMRQDAYAEAIEHADSNRWTVRGSVSNLREELQDAIKAVEACTALLERIDAPRPWLDLAAQVRRDLKSIELRVWGRG